MTEKLSHLREIQGLRALAVLAVITNHLVADFMPGGFLGVDIFFVISGYLITGQLVEISSNGQLGRNLLNFYSRRIRRILPSALLVIWVTVGLAFKYLGPVIGNETLRDGRWSTLFIANFHFNSLKVDYFGQGVSSPLLQHFWSLAVEEQFYILWPIALLLLVLLSKTHSKKILLTLLLVIAALSFSSIFVLEKTLTYFATQTRIWELSIGSLIAIIGAKAWPHILQWVAFLIILASLFFVGPTDQVPGLKVIPALLAVVALLNVSNARLQFILGNRVMHYIGDLSFVLYLWHWPVIELHRQLAVSPLSTSDLFSLLGITFVLAIITHHLVENPIRFNKYLVQHPGVTVISGSAAITLSVLASLLLVKG